MPTFRVSLAAAFLLCAPLCLATPATYYLATGQTGAQTQIDINHTSSWQFTPNTDFLFGGGLFDMKDGQSASADLVVTLYEGPDTTGTVLTTFTLSNTDFCSQVSNCGQYNYHQFFLPDAVALSTGTTYFATLTSDALDTQSDAYFIKSDTFFVSDSQGNPIDPSPVGGTQGTLTDTPEPATAGLAGLSLAATVLLVRRRRVLQPLATRR